MDTFLRKIPKIATVLERKMCTINFKEHNRSIQEKEEVYVL